MSRYLYLVRHGEQLDAEHGLPDGPLSPRGRRQAEAIASRLSGIPFTRAWHSPLERAEETARIMTQRMPALESEPSSLLMDCIPSGPPPSTNAWDAFFGSISEAQIAAGQAQMADAASEFLTPALGENHELIITHNFVISWIVREVLEAPSWRWMGLNQANCGLTIVRIRSTKPNALIAHNDLGHLPVELRTGEPVVQPY